MYVKRTNGDRPVVEMRIFFDFSTVTTFFNLTTTAQPVENRECNIKQSQTQIETGPLTYFYSSNSELFSIHVNRSVRLPLLTSPGATC